MPDDSFFIDHEGGTISKTLILVKDTISLHHSAFGEIAEYRKCDSELFCEFAIGRNTVDTQTKNLSLGCFEFGEISLIRL